MGVAGEVSVSPVGEKSLILFSGIVKSLNCVKLTWGVIDGCDVGDAITGLNGFSWKFDFLAVFSVGVLSEMKYM